MAAVSAALMSGLSTGDHIVAAKAMFGSCRTVIVDILPRFGVTHTLVDGGDIAQWQAAMRPNTKMLFLETPANPTLDIVDIAAVAKIADAAGARVWSSTTPSRAPPFNGLGFRRTYRLFIRRPNGLDGQGVVVLAARSCAVKIF